MIPFENSDYLAIAVILAIFGTFIAAWIYWIVEIVKALIDELPP